MKDEIAKSYDFKHPPNVDAPSFGHLANVFCRYTGPGFTAEIERDSQGQRRAKSIKWNETDQVKGWKIKQMRQALEAIDR